jgi:hypothetical protein
MVVVCMHLARVAFEAAGMKPAKALSPSSSCSQTVTMHVQGGGQ